MSNIDANEIVDQTIADLDAIEAAIEEKGVNVSEETPTSYYDDKIRSIQGGNVIVDQTYYPESSNAQSGKAVAQAVSTKAETSMLYTFNTNLDAKITANSQSITALQQDMGDIDTALDNIIAMQNSYMGGDSV